MVEFTLDPPHALHDASRLELIRVHLIQVHSSGSLMADEVSEEDDEERESPDPPPDPFSRSENGGKRMGNNEDPAAADDVDWGEDI